MTVRELSDRMTADELIEWMAHDTLTMLEREAAQVKAENEAKARSSRRR